MEKSHKYSRLSDHTLEKKSGLLSTPLNYAMRSNLKLNSWHNDRMPEYLWLGLILNYYGREEAFNKIYPIINKLSSIEDSITHPKMSQILNLSREKQLDFYNEILRYIDKAVLCPLTILINHSTNPLFFKMFNITTMSVDERIKKIKQVVKQILPHQSNEATDLRFLASSILFLRGRIIFHESNAKNTLEAFKNYLKTNHDDEKMRKYRPTIRSLEGIDEISKTTEDFFSKLFWEKIGRIDHCKYYYINYEEKKQMKFEDFIKDTRHAFDIELSKNKSNLLNDERYNVIVGSVCYSFKIFCEISINNIGNSILGRHGNRTLVEQLIILKYLLHFEKDKPDIWTDYKIYGLSKLKLQVLKCRETNCDDSHILLPVIESIISEPLYEEFLDVDLKYFDKSNIRNKSELANAKDIYDRSYEYDTSYVHGFWGAIRESSFLICDNPLHKNHTFPDIYGIQKLPDIKNEAYKNIQNIIKLYDNIYTLPMFYKEKYLI